MKLKKHPVSLNARERREAAASQASLLGRPGAAAFQGRLVYGAQSIKTLRQRLGLTQKGFARLMMVVPGAVESWEQGRRVPDTGRMALIHLLHEHPTPFRTWLEDASKVLVLDRQGAPA